MIKIAGCGDIFIFDRLPVNQYKGFNKIVKLLNSHEIKFGNFETTIHNNEGYPSLFPGGVCNGIPRGSKGCSVIWL